MGDVKHQRRFALLGCSPAVGLATALLISACGEQCDVVGVWVGKHVLGGEVLDEGPTVGVHLELEADGTARLVLHTPQWFDLGGDIVRAEGTWRWRGKKLALHLPDLRASDPVIVRVEEGALRIVFRPDPATMQLMELDPGGADEVKVEVRLSRP